jgi:hypothetical protein
MDRRCWWIVANPDRTPFSGNFRIAGHSPGTWTVGVSLFGLVNERIGDFALMKKCRWLLIGRQSELQNSSCFADSIWHHLVAGRIEVIKSTMSEAIRGSLFASVTST